MSLEVKMKVEMKSEADRLRRENQKKTCERFKVMEKMRKDEIIDKQIEKELQARIQKHSK